MRQSPVPGLIVLALALLASAFILMGLTHPEPTPSSQAEQVAEAIAPPHSIPVSFEAASPVPWKSLSITLAGKAVAAVDPGSPKIELELPATGADLVCSAIWDWGDTNALRIVAKRRHEKFEASWWGGNTITEVFTIPPSSE